MIKSFWLPLVLEGGLHIETRKGEPDNNVVLRTIIQLDGAVITFVDSSRGGDDLDIQARHNNAVLQACAPLRTTLKRIDRLAVGAALLAPALWLGFAFRGGLMQRLLSVAVAAALHFLAKWAIRKIALLLVKWRVQRLFATASP